METLQSDISRTDGQFTVLEGVPTADGVSAQCGRWKNYLLSVSTAYRELVAEREAGWKSESLDAWYSQRQNRSTPTGPENGIGTKSGNTSVVPVTSFVHSDVGKLCRRYCDHARRILTATAPEYFSAVPPPLTQAPQQAEGGGGVLPTFLDLGCAPGGVSRYLVTGLQWCGVGVTLPVNRGGIAFDSSWTKLPKASARYELVEGSILEEDWKQHSAIRGKNFYFVNGGAVQDYGQREEDVAAGCGASDSTAVHPVLPWFNFLVPQLRVAVDHVRDGGVIMLVFGRPECASFSILLAHLFPLIDGSIHIMETVHAAKTPVYVLLTGVRATSTVEGRAPWERLLQLLTSGCKDYWLGNTDEAMELAQIGFERHRKELESVWEKSRQFLQKRRLDAESVMQRVKGERAVKHSRGDEGVQTSQAT